SGGGCRAGRSGQRSGSSMPESKRPSCAILPRREGLPPPCRRLLFSVSRRWLRGPSVFPLGAMNKNFKTTFSMTSSYRTTCRDVNSFFCLMKKPRLCRSARPESSREVRKRCLRAPFARTQSEPRRRLALASGFALFRSFGIDRLDELAHGAVSAWPTHGRTRRSSISLKDVSSECSTMVLAFRGHHLYHSRRRHSSPAFALLVNAAGQSCSCSCSLFVRRLHRCDP